MFKIFLKTTKTIFKREFFEKNEQDNDFIKDNIIGAIWPYSVIDPQWKVFFR